jgi:hypothetical protein
MFEKNLLKFLAKKVYTEYKYNMGGYYPNEDDLSKAKMIHLNEYKNICDTLRKVCKVRLCKKDKQSDDFYIRETTS